MSKKPSNYRIRIVSRSEGLFIELSHRDQLIFHAKLFHETFDAYSKSVTRDLTKDIIHYNKDLRTLRILSKSNGAAYSPKNLFAPAVIKPEGQDET